MLVVVLVVFDFFYKEYCCIVVDEVCVVIINVDGQKVDFDYGIWLLIYVDYFFEIYGVGFVIEWL